MLTRYYIVLLLFQYALASFQFENSGCKEESWLCLVNGKCADSTVDDKWLQSTKSDLMEGDVNIDIDNDVVIVKYRKIEGEMLKDVKLSIASVEKFGCKVDNEKMQPVIEGDAMKFSDAASYINDNIYACAGYVKVDKDATIDKYKLTVTLTTGTPTNYANTAPTPDPDPGPLRIPFGCDPLLVNVRWKDGYDEEYMNKKKIILPQNDLIDSCDEAHGGSSFGLFYKRGVDVSPLPVIHLSCSNNERKYSIKFNGETELTSRPFMLFCAEYVSTKCPKPEEIKDYTQVRDIDFTPGTGITPPTFKCDGDSYVVKNGTEENRVAGTPVCQGNPSNRMEPVWTIQPLTGDPIVFSAAACDPGLSCWTKRMLESECDECGDECECSQARILQSGASCPNGSTVGTESLKRTHSQELTCHPQKSHWQPAMGTANVRCYFNTDRPKIEVPSSWTKEKIRVFGLGALIPVLLIISFIIFLIYYVCRRKSRIAAQKLKKKIEDSGLGVDAFNPDGTEKDALTIRKEQCPGVEERLLRRRSERIQLTFQNLSFVRPDYITDGLVEEFGEYSVHERTKFAEGVVDGMGTVTVMHTFLQLFLSCLGTEDEFKVWYHFVTAVRIAYIGLKMKKGTQAGERLMLIVRQFGLLMLTRHGAFPLKGEGEGAIEMRGFAYYSLLRASGSDMVVKMCQLYDTMLIDVTPGLRRIVWSTVVRKKGKFDEIKEYLTQEMTNTSRKDDIRWGTIKEDLIYALCSCTDREKCEPFLNTVIREPQYSAKEVLAGFTAMVRDFDDCHDAAKFLYTERHSQIKAKMGVETDEYRQIFKMFYQFATISLNSDDWLQKFMAADDTFNAEERQLLGAHLAKAVIYGGVYKKIHRGCFNKRKQYDLRRTLTGIEKKYSY